MKKDPATRRLEHKKAIKPFVHTAQRLWERYRMRISASEYEGLCEAIARDFPKLNACHTYMGRYDLKYRYRGRNVGFVFDRNAGLVITVCPKFTRPLGTGKCVLGKKAIRKSRKPDRRSRADKYRNWEDF